MLIKNKFSNTVTVLIFLVLTQQIINEFENWSSHGTQLQSLYQFSLQLQMLFVIQISYRSIFLSDKFKPWEIYFYDG